MECHQNNAVGVSDMNDFTMKMIISTSSTGVPEIASSHIPVYAVLDSLMQLGSSDAVKKTLALSDEEYEASLAFASAQVRSMYANYKEIR